MPAAATSLGSLLRQERLRKQLNLARIAQETRICIAILEAIEQDQFECIPAGSYRRHFLRQYACALGLDGAEIVAEFKKHYEEPPVPLPIPPKNRRARVWTELAWALAAIASLIVTYEAAQTVLTAAKHQSRAAAVALPQATAQREPPAPVTAKPAEVAQPAEGAAPPPTAPVHVSFTAAESVWVSVKCDGTATYSGLLTAAQSKTFDAIKTVTALIGNAGGLQVSVNGKSLGSLGADGKVEMIEITANGARRIARPPSTDSSAVPQ